MSRQRKTRPDLPQRVYEKHGAFYFVDKTNKWHRLGKSFAEAMQAYGELLHSDTLVTTMAQLFDRYQREIMPKKAPNTQKANIKEIANLRHAFGHMRPEQIKAKHLYKYADARNAPVAANREWSLMSQVFKHGIKWGDCEENPCRGLMRHTETPGKHYIEHEDFLGVLAIAPPLIQCAMWLAYLTALRPNDLLGLTRQHLTEKGVAITTHKTGRKMVFEWTDDLRTVVNRALDLPRDVSTIYLLPQRDGQRYTTDGFRSVWRQLMLKALKNGVIQERFQFRDLRAKAASDSENDELLGHLDARTLRRHYKRKPLKVRPLDMVGNDT